MKAKELRNGQRFKYGGIEWVKLDDSHGGVLVLAVNKQADAAFDKNLVAMMSGKEGPRKAAALEKFKTFLAGECKQEKKKEENKQ